jgi:hypothetical protein
MLEVEGILYKYDASSYEELYTQLLDEVIEVGLDEECIWWDLKTEERDKLKEALDDPMIQACVIESMRPYLISILIEILDKV